MRTVTTTAALVALCACATPRRAYVPPAGDLGAYARITLRNMASSPLYVNLWDDPLTCSVGQVYVPINTATFVDGATLVVHAKKGEPLTLWNQYSYKTGVYSTAPCHVITTLVPTAASYVATYTQESDRRICDVVWAEGDETSARPLPADRVVRREFNLAFGQTGPWCTALTDAQRAGLGVAKPAATPAN